MWCGILSCDVESYCGVWYRVVWCGVGRVMWCGILSCGVESCCGVWCGVGGVMWCGIMWCSVVCGVVWCGMLWSHVVGCGVVWSVHSIQPRASRRQEPFHIHVENDSAHPDLVLHCSGLVEGLHFPPLLVLLHRVCVEETEVACALNCSCGSLGLLLLVSRTVGAVRSGVEQASSQPCGT